MPKIYKLHAMMLVNSFVSTPLVNSMFSILYLLTHFLNANFLAIDRIVSKMDGKYVVMRHMEHPNPEVQKEALLCTQKLLVVSWDSLK